MAGADPTHHRIVTALSQLATLVRVHDPVRAEEIERRATELMRSAPYERTHADLVRDALSAALDVFVDRVKKASDAEVRAAYVDARRALRAITDDAPLRHQTIEVTAALRALTNVVAMLHGADPIFATPELDVAIGYNPQELAERAKRTSVIVSELARARDWKSAGQNAARALDALADVVAVCPLAVKRTEWQLAVSAIRFEALELQREGLLSLDRSDHVKSGLQAAVDGLETLRDRESPVLRLLIANARLAVEGIDPDAIFVFQRGMIQEAFRATADAYLVLASEPASPGAVASRRASPR